MDYNSRYKIGLAMAIIISMPYLSWCSMNKQETDLSKYKTYSLNYLKARIGPLEKTTYKFKQIHLQTFLSLFATSYNLNVINESTRRTKPLSFSLKQLHPADLFDTIMRSFGVDWYVKEGLILVVNRTPMQIFQLNYMQVESFSETLKEAFPNLTLTINLLTNTLVARGPSEQLDQLRNIVQIMDTPPLQVLIEAKILETNLETSEAIGINMLSPIGDQGSAKSMQTPGYNAVVENGVQKGLFMTVIAGGYTAELNALSTNSNTDILANPKLLVTNHNTARIVAGQRLGFVTTTQTQTATIQEVSFLDTGIRLKITPHISKDGYILMEIEPEVSEGRIENNIPRKTTTETQTQVLVKDGETIVIGGLIQKKKIEQMNGVPILSDIPLINLIFRKTKKEDVKREVLVLITPHIIKPVRITKSSQKISKGIQINPLSNKRLGEKKYLRLEKIRKKNPTSNNTRQNQPSDMTIDSDLLKNTNKKDLQFTVNSLVK